MKLVDVDPVTGTTFVFCSDAIPVDTVLLQGLRLHAPTHRLLVGHSIVLGARGLAGESPFSFASVRASCANYSWRVEQGTVVELSRGPTGGWRTTKFGFQVGVTGLTRGNTVVTLTLSLRPIGYPVQTFTASFPISVAPVLHLLSPSHLLLFPSASFRVRTSHDNLPGLEYQVGLGGNVTLTFVDVATCVVV